MTLLSSSVWLVAFTCFGKGVPCAQPCSSAAMPDYQINTGLSSGHCGTTSASQSRWRTAGLWHRRLRLRLKRITRSFSTAATTRQTLRPSWPTSITSRSCTFTRSARRKAPTPWSTNGRNRASPAYSFIDNDGLVFYFTSDNKAPRQRVIAIDIRKAQAANWKTVMPESAQTVVSASQVNHQFIADYLADARSMVKVFDRNGGLVREVALTGIGSAAGFKGKAGACETFYSCIRAFSKTKCSDLFCRPAQPLAAWIEREHQWPVARDCRPLELSQPCAEHERTGCGERTVITTELAPTTSAK